MALFIPFTQVIAPFLQFVEEVNLTILALGSTLGTKKSPDEGAVSLAQKKAAQKGG
jgi:hypothetical protein